MIEYERTCQINIYPDASGIGTARSVGASEADISLMRDAGFSVHVNMKNPVQLRKDRVNAIRMPCMCNSKGD